MLSNFERKIDDSLISEQLNKICCSEEFRSKELLCRFLSFIVSECLAGREQNIKGYTIGVEVFKRGDDFDPGQDALVRIHAGRLRRLLDYYYLKEGINDEILIEIPKGGYAPVFSSRQTPGSTDYKLNISLDNELLIKPTVAIIPFKNHTENPANEYFALGFSEDLSVELTRYEDLIVYNGIYEEDILENNSLNNGFFKKKGIRFFIQGSVQRNDEAARIFVRLTDTLENRQIWAECYQKDMSVQDIFEIQENIAKEVAGLVGSEYGLIPQKLSQDSQRVKPNYLDTYLAGLKFYYFQIHQTPESAFQAFRSLETAIKNEPDSGVASAMLAIMHGNRFMLDLPGAEESYELIGILAEKANRLDYKSQIVEVAMAFKCFVYNEKEHFFQIIEKVLAKKLCFSAKLGGLAFHMSLYGDWERGKVILDKLMNANIGLPKYFHGSTMLYYYRKKEYDKALIEANKYDIPTIFWGPMLRAAVLGQLNKPEDAMTEILQMKKLNPDFEEKARYLIGLYVKEEELLDHVVDGLLKAGLNIK